MDNKQIHFSMSKTTLILASIIIGVLLIIIVCLLARGGRREGVMMRQGQNGGYMRMQERSYDNNRGQMQSERGWSNEGQPQQPTTGAVEMDTSATGQVMQ